jgi:hypothetical protein
LNAEQASLEGDPVRKRSAALRHVFVAILATTIATSAVLVAGAQAATPIPKIDRFSADPTELTWRGGTLTLRATTTATTTCTFSSDYAIKGLPDTGPCPGGHPATTLDIARNLGTTVKYLKFTLTANGGKGTSPATGTITVPETPQPASITSFTASTTKLPATGGNVTLTAKLVRAVACVLSVSPKVSGLPEGYNCTSGTVTKTVTLPASTSGTEPVYIFNLAASGTGNGTANAQVTVDVSAQEPKITSFTASPATLPASGGTVTLTVKVADALGCNFGDSWTNGNPNGDNPVSNLPASISCSSGTYRFKATVVATTVTVADTITFAPMTVDSQAGTVTATQKPAVVQAAA